MALNVFAGEPTILIAKQTISFINAGLTSGNTEIIYEVGPVLKSYRPNRAINGITGFQRNKGYYILPTMDMDLQNWTIAPVVPALPGKALIVFTGESNSGGKALNSSATTHELSPRPEVQILNNTSLVFEDLHIGVNNLLGHNGIDPDISHGFELQMANRMEAGTFIGSPCYLVKTGQGGSKISDWAEGALYGGTTNCWQIFQDRVDEAISLITTATGAAPGICIFYSQGINDVLEGTDLEVWKTDTLAHFDKIRVKYGEVPIIMTKFMASRTALNTAIDEIVPQRDNLFSVETEDASLLDSNHWDYAGMKLVSDRLQDKALQNYAL